MEIKIGGCSCGGDLYKIQESYYDNKLKKIVKRIYWICKLCGKQY